jgi:hypothetical protein
MLSAAEGRGVFEHREFLPIIPVEKVCVVIDGGANDSVCGGRQGRLGQDSEDCAEQGVDMGSELVTRMICKCFQHPASIDSGMERMLCWLFGD